MAEKLMPNWVIFKREIQRSILTLKFQAFYALFVGLTLVTNLVIFKHLSSQLKHVQTDITQQLLEGMITRGAVLAGFIVVASMFAGIMAEKAHRIIEMILCYPVSVKSFLYSKVLSILLVYTLCSYSIALWLYIGACIIENALMPISFSVLVTALVSPVVIGFGVFVFNSTLLLVTSNASIGNRVVFLCFFLLYFIGARPSTRGNNWSILLGYCVLSIVLFGLATVIQKKYLNKERLILS